MGTHAWLDGDRAAPAGARRRRRGWRDGPLRTVAGAAVALGMIGASTVAVSLVGPSHRAAAASSVGGPISRSEAIARAQNWWERSPTYNNSRASSTLVSDVDGAHRYGADCSGMISMAWHIVPGQFGGRNTGSLDDSDISIPIANSDLKPGDLLDDVGDGHAVLFEAWAADHVHFSYYSFGATPMVHYNGGSGRHEGPLGSFQDGAHLASHPAANYRAYRYKNIVDDAGGGGEAGVVLYASDINADGRSDIAAQYGDGRIRAWASTGNIADNALFPGSGVLIGQGWTVGQVQRITTADFNGDGRSDILGQRADGTLVAFAGTANVSGDYTLYPGAGAIVGTGWQPGNVQRILAADFNGDGRTDIAAQYADGLIRAWASTGNIADNALFPGDGVLIGRDWSTTDVPRIMLADVNGDHRADILGQRADGTLIAFASTGNLGGDYTLYQGSAAAVGSAWTTSNVPRIIVADFNGDGRTDIAAQYPTGLIRAWASTGTVANDALFPGSGVLIGQGWTSGDIPRIVLGDFNGDHRADIIGQRPDGTLVAFAGTGNLGADYTLYPGGGATVGTGWTAGNVQRIV
jgi:hypothetical protein